MEPVQPVWECILIELSARIHYCDQPIWGVSVFIGLPVETGYLSYIAYISIGQPAEICIIIIISVCPVQEVLIFRYVLKGDPADKITRDILSRNKRRRKF